ncbi:unnamed protein product, partial [marine sediment metagenome]
SLTKSIIDQFELLISQGTLKPGERLPSETKLAEELSVSRPALREALRALELVGVIQKKSGDGTYISEDIVSEPVRFMFLMRKSETHKLFEARKVLETGLAGIAADKRSDEDIERMQVALNEMKRFLHSSKKKFLKGDMAFHLAIIEATHNEILRGLSIPLNELLWEGRAGKSHTPEVSVKSIEYHEGLLKAIEKRDSTLASKIMLEHLNYVEKFL